MKKSVTEFGVIVLGVLAALLAENTWSARMEQEDARSYLVRLTDEVGSNLAAVEMDQAWGDLACPSSRQLLEHVRKPDATEDPSTLLLLAVAGMIHQSTPYRRATFEDLIATGSLRLFRDAHVREAVLSAYSEATREQFRPPLTNEFRSAVIQALPQQFIAEVNTECLADGREFLSSDVRECSVLPRAEEASTWVDRLVSTAGFEAALAERVFHICQWQQFHVGLIRTELTAALEVLDRELDREAF